MFHLNFKPQVSQNKISRTDTVLFIGSCFSETINQKLVDLKFNTLSNPLGIVFNPKSMCTTLLNCIHKTEFSESHFVEKDNQWFSLDAHSSIFSEQKENLKNTIKQTVEVWNQKIKMANWLIITFGTAYYYEINETKQIAANCHKLPANYFTKKILSVASIVSDYDAIINKLKIINPNLKIIFTVSPVKHLRDGVVENNLSKSILIQSVHELTNKYNNCFYFPSYELITDDLRDYRFYESDMAHPTKQATNYVFDKFVEVYFTEETKNINKQIFEINLALNHKVFNDESPSHKNFKQNMFLKCEQLVKQFPFLDLTKELNYFKPTK